MKKILMILLIAICFIKIKSETLGVLRPGQEGIKNERGGTWYYKGNDPNCNITCASHGGVVKNFSGQPTTRDQVCHSWNNGFSFACGSKIPEQCLCNK